MNPYDTQTRLWHLDGKSDGLLLAARIVGEFAKTAGPASGLWLSILEEIKVQHTRTCDELMATYKEKAA